MDLDYFLSAKRDDPKVSSVKKLKDFCRWFLGKSSYQHLHSSEENFVFVAVSMSVTRISAVGF